MANSVSRYPSYRCPKCSTLVPLDFRPIKNVDRWKQFQCPTCQVQVQTIIDAAIKEDFPLIT